MLPLKWASHNIYFVITLHACHVLIMKYIPTQNSEVAFFLRACSEVHRATHHKYRVGVRSRGEGNTCLLRGKQRTLGTLNAGVLYHAVWDTIRCGLTGRLEPTLAERVSTGSTQAGSGRRGQT